MSRDRWSKLRDIATAIAAIAVPVVIAHLGNEINVSLKDRDVKLKTVELAISILKDDPKANPESPKLRNWAMTVIDKYSGISLPQDAKEELQSVPITRPRREFFTCGKFAASLEISAHHTVTISEDEQSCQFSINGAARPRIKCTNIPVSIAVPPQMSVSMTEENDKCLISVD